MSEYLLRDLLVEVIQGDDYQAVDNRAVLITGRGVCWPAALAGTKLIVYEPHTDCGAQVASVLSPLSILEIVGVYTPAAAAVPAVPATPLTPATPFVPGTTAMAQFDLTRVDTLKLSTGVRRYMFEVRGLFASGGVTTLARGLVTVYPSGL
jgi:hypothetical protein